MPDLDSLKLAFSTLKMDKIDEDTFGINESNEQFLDEVYNQFPMRVEPTEVCFWRAKVAKKFMKEHLKHNFPEVAESDKKLKVAVVAHGVFL